MGLPPKKMSAPADHESAEPAPPHMSRLEHVGREDAAAIMEGSKPVDHFPLPEGAKAHISRRGSFMIEHRRDGEPVLDIVHSERTATALGRLEHNLAQPPSDTRSARQREAEEAGRKPAYVQPSLTQSVHGHELHAQSFGWTPDQGFQPLGEGRYGSGKAGGHFSQKAIEQSGWLGRAGSGPEAYDSASHHHSETDFFLQNHALMQSRAAMVHRMSGANDMCSHCEAGFQNTLLSGDRPQAVIYTGGSAFQSQGKWGSGEMAGAPAAVQGKLARARPEEMMTPDLKKEVTDHVGRMANLRLPPHVRADSAPAPASPMAARESISAATHALPPADVQMSSERHQHEPPTIAGRVHKRHRDERH